MTAAAIMLGRLSIAAPAAPGARSSGEPERHPPLSNPPAHAAEHAAWLKAVADRADRDAFVSLFDHYAPRIKSWLMQGRLDHGKAEELTQEVMLTVWQRSAQYDPAIASPGTWIFTIARNKRIDLLRKDRAFEYDLADPVEILSQEADPEVGADQRLSDRQENDRLREAMARLPESQAALLMQAFYEDKPHSLIAVETGLPLGTVKSRLRLAVMRLRRLLGEAA